ncbi:MAG: hypothetical protein Q7R50_01875 [Dehalococcoidales bacterium]|nr:hypothetical protein [Dehalococcoidales bacterium]
MSMAIGHFAAGAGAAFAVVHLLPPTVRRKLPNYGVLGILSGVWAMLPDLCNFIPLLVGFHNSRWANIFFLHYSMDFIIDPRDSILASAVLVGFMMTLMLILLADDFWERYPKPLQMLSTFRLQKGTSSVISRQICQNSDSKPNENTRKGA